MPKRIKETIVHESTIFRVKDIDLLFENGKKMTYSIIERPDTALIVPLTENGDILFLKEYQAALDTVLLGLPKGGIETGDTALETANRELQEETGYRAGRLDALGIVSMSPGHLTQKTHIFLARDLMESRLTGDEEHPMEIVRHPFARIEELIESGELSEARMIAALYLARRFLQSTKE